MSSWHSYPKIFAIGHAALKELFEDEVIVEEKVDGSQFSFGVYNGELKCRSKGKEQVIDAPDKMFDAAVAQIKARQPMLIEGVRYSGEYLNKPKHNALAYDRTPKDNIIIFDIATGEEQYMSYDAKKAEAERLGFECVPLLYKGRVTDAAVFMRFMETISVLGGQKIEGVVVKNYAKFGPEKKILLGKHVSEAFKEVHKETWGESNPGKNDMIGFLGHKYRTTARWNKAIQHLKEAGNYTQSPKDIGNLIREVQADIEAECREEIIKTMMDWAMPHLRRAVVRGLPEWYKEQLVNIQFQDRLYVEGSQEPQPILVTKEET